MFEVMLLSPSRAEWAKQIKYVIFDEVHCLGLPNGDVWEHILTLTRAPFLALSATIGNPQTFQDWLVRICNLRNNTVCYVLFLYLCSVVFSNRIGVVLV